MTSPMPDEFPWSRKAARLRTWFIVYLLTISGGITLAVNSTFENEIALALIFGSLIPYIACVAFAYQVQDGMNRAKVYKSGAWQVIAGAVLLNPFILGFLIPASVLWATKRIERKIRAGKLEYPTSPPPRARMT